MRIRRRSAVVLALALTATLGVGLIAFPARAAAAPPVVQTCTPKPSTFSDSCVRLTVNALAPPIGQVPENVRLGVRMRAVLDPPSPPNNWSVVTLRFDDDIFLNLGTISVCFPSEVSNRTIAQAYEQCGPGADGNPPGEGNAFLSLPGNVSGIAVNNQGSALCMMVFRGPNWDPPPTGGPLFPTLTLYARGYVNPTTGCDNPAINTAGAFAIVGRGFLTKEAASSSYDWKLRVPDFKGLADFYATLQRGSVFRARCPAGTSPHKLVGIFDYTGTEPTDTIAPPYMGTTDTCP